MARAVPRRPFAIVASNLPRSRIYVSKPLQCVRRFQKASCSPVPDFAFAFDIDGVLLRSSEPLPRAKKALKYLQSRNVPFVLLTNGGGKHESQRVSELSERLEVPIDSDMFIQSHTPFASLVRHRIGKSKKELRDEHILVVGGEGDNCRKVAESYGFRKVLIPSDIYHHHPNIWPFSSPFSAYHSSHAHHNPLPLPIHNAASPHSASPTENLRIAAIFVYNDPRDWGLDLQLILDLLMSCNGYLGTRSEKNGQGRWQEDGQPELWFANPDLWWAAGWHMPRLGSGSFRAALEGVWREITRGEELKCQIWGKPSKGAFGFAEDRLRGCRRKLGGQGEMGSVYMVGDNPASDITGANTFRSPHGTKWHSILVRSGVFAGEPPPNSDYTPTTTVDDVWDAVSWAVEKEGM